MTGTKPYHPFLPAIFCIILVLTMACTTISGDSARISPASHPVATPPQNATSKYADINAQLSSVNSDSAIWQEAYRIFRNMKETQYNHTTYVDDKNGIYRFDCLGFVDIVINTTDPSAYGALSDYHSRPPIARYAAYFRSLSNTTPNAAGWSRVAHPIDLKPGDVCLWLKPSTLDQGHMWIIAGTPRVNPNLSQEVLVRIFDSDGPHADDTRTHIAEGLGTGILGMMVNSEGEPIGLYWNTSATSLGEKDTTIVCGRLNR